MASERLKIVDLRGGAQATIKLYGPGSKRDRGDAG